MFTSAKIKANRGKGKEFYLNHLSCNDYYSEKSKVTGKWKGELSKEFGLCGHFVKSEEFCLFQQNINPGTKEKLTVRNVSNSVRFYDFQCSAQKSISIMSLFDPRLLEAHRRGVVLGMKELERLAAVRVRKGENAATKNFEFTGKIVYAQYHHDNSRLLDPQIHTHNVIVNVTRDSEGYKALETSEMCRAIRYAGKAYQNYMACECRRLGYEIDMQKDGKGKITGFEIRGVAPEMIERCSKRRKQIEERIDAFLKEKGRSPNAEEVKTMTLDTRSAKLLNMSDEAVLRHKLNLFDAQETATFQTMAASAKRRTGYHVLELHHEKLANQIRSVGQELFERQGVIQYDKLAAEVLNQNLGNTELESLKKEMNRVPELVNLGGSDCNPYFSTRENIEYENYVYNSIDQQKNLFEPLKSDFVPFADAADGFDHTAQRNVIDGILSSPDRFAIFRGVAGAGKTSTLQELCRGLKAGGISNIYMIAPTNSAVDVLKSEKFEQSQTVASFLQCDSKPPQGSYLIIDESGLNSLKQGAEIIKLAQEKNYRVLFVGEDQQHKSVEYGDFFRLMETYTDITKTSLTEIYRQQSRQYREAVLQCALGDAKGAYETFQQHGFIHEGKSDYLENAAKSFFEFTDSGSKLMDCLAIAPTIAEGEKLTSILREKLKHEKILSLEEHEIKSFQSWGWTRQELASPEKYQVGYHVFFTQNRKGIASAGEVFEIAGIKDGYLHFTNGKMLHLASSKGFIDCGISNPLPIASGDLMRLTVNYRTEHGRLSNGSILQATENRNEYIVFDTDKKPVRKITLPDHFAGLKYGWVITSHASQGRTSSRVVVAAEKMTRDAFYVSMSRGKFNAALHVPDQKFFESELLHSKTERLAVRDLVNEKIIRSMPDLTPEEVRKKVSPNKDFLTPAGRKKSLFARIMRFARNAGRTLKLHLRKENRMTLVKEVIKNESKERGFGKDTPGISGREI